MANALQGLQMPELLEVAHRVLAEWDDEELQQLVDRAGARGVQGDLKT